MRKLCCRDFSRFSDRGGTTVTESKPSPARVRKNGAWLLLHRSGDRHGCWKFPLPPVNIRREAGEEMFRETGGKRLKNSCDGAVGARAGTGLGRTVRQCYRYMYVWKCLARALWCPDGRQSHALWIKAKRPLLTTPSPQSLSLGRGPQQEHRSCRPLRATPGAPPLPLPPPPPLLPPPLPAACRRAPKGVGKIDRFVVAWSEERGRGWPL